MSPKESILNVFDKRYVYLSIWELDWGGIYSMVILQVSKKFSQISGYVNNIFESFISYRQHAISKGELFILSIQRSLALSTA